MLVRGIADIVFVLIIGVNIFDKIIIGTLVARFCELVGIKKMDKNKIRVISNIKISGRFCFHSSFNKNCAIVFVSHEKNYLYMIEIARIVLNYGQVSSIVDFLALQ